MVYGLGPTLTAHSKEVSEDKPIKGIYLDRKPEIPRRKKEEAPPTEAADIPERPIKRAVDAADQPSLKRARDENGEPTSEVKKAKTAPPAEAEIVVIEDDGAILIPDD